MDHVLALHNGQTSYHYKVEDTERLISTSENLDVVTVDM